MESPGPRPGERAAFLLRDRRSMLMLTAVGVMAFVVVTVIGFSGAYFTSESTSPDNAFSAGSVDVELSATGALINGAGLYPGETRTGTQTVTNVAHAAKVVLDAGGFGPDTRLADVLVATVYESAPNSQQLYTGPLSRLQDVGLGYFAAGEARTYKIQLQWPKDQTSPTLQGAQVTFDFTWLASSTP